MTSTDAHFDPSIYVVRDSSGDYACNVIAVLVARGVLLTTSRGPWIVAFPSSTHRWTLSLGCDGGELLHALGLPRQLIGYVAAAVSEQLTCGPRARIPLDHGVLTLALVEP